MSGMKRETNARGEGWPVPASREIVGVMCAFCGGEGQDPFGIMSPLATCQVCGGTGRRVLRTPTSVCPFCGGMGAHPGTRMTCTTCGGVGTVEIPQHSITCPCCGGSGQAADHVWPDSPLSCSCCGGKGVVAAINAIMQYQGGPKAR